MTKWAPQNMQYEKNVCMELAANINSIHFPFVVFKCGKQPYIPAKIICNSLLAGGTICQHSRQYLAVPWHFFVWRIFVFYFSSHTLSPVRNFVPYSGTALRCDHVHTYFLFPCILSGDVSPSMHFVFMQLCIFLVSTFLVVLFTRYLLTDFSHLRHK